MTDEMAKAYTPKAVEARWYDFWQENNYFKPTIDRSRKPFVVIMPPPNVTGALHTGHALFVTLEDIMIRYHRMRGDPTLWLPGSDHAGISGETTVEKVIRAEGKTKRGMGREAFLARVWQWMDEYRDTILNQMKVIGASADWSRNRFTMEPGIQAAVRHEFKTLYDEGLIYRGEYIVNWDPVAQTTVSDLEVEYETEQSFLWHLRYPLKDDPTQGIVVATTRPETMLGDTAVAVNPDDPRYSDLVGKMLLLPLVGREIPIVADAMVKMEFGTGAVKTTPAHDPNDFEVGKRHNLPMINIMNPDATINDNGGGYAGLTREEARKAVLRDLEAAGALVKTEPYTHEVGHSEKSGAVVEPRLSMQWWVKIKPLAGPALAAAEYGSVRFVPERQTKVFTSWMENIHDWPISRQLWWGHRIPAWFCDNAHISVTEAESLSACETCGSENVRQETDVLDTWFSSGMWPFITLDWPQRNGDLDYFYPGSVMETGYDILFFWVARMVMFGIHFMGQPPFHTVYLHGLVRDAQGRKMSKTLGNVVDPLIWIEKYGADALRYTLSTSSTPGIDTKLDEKKVESARNFCNKLWNATRYLIGGGAGDITPIGYSVDGQSKLDPFAPGLSLADRWIISRYHTLIEDVTRNIEAYNYGEAGRAIQEFMWSEFADWYIEISKLALYGEDRDVKYRTQQILVGVLEGCLRLLHPFMPFVTEELWHYLPLPNDALENPNAAGKPEALITCNWPKPGAIDDAALETFGAIIEAVRGIRNVRTEANVEGIARIPAIIVAPADKLPIFANQRDTLIKLAGLDPARLELHPAPHPAPEQAITLALDAGTVYLPLAGLVDVAKERARLTKEIDGSRGEIERLAKQLGNESFMARAKPEVVADVRARHATAIERLARLEERLAALPQEPPNPSF